jgi:hypothetical protein
VIPAPAGPQRGPETHNSQPLGYPFKLYDGCPVTAGLQFFADEKVSVPNGGLLRPKAFLERRLRRRVSGAEAISWTLQMIAAAAGWMTFVFYPLCCVGQLIWTLTIMRETKGFPLEQHRR